MKLKDSVALVTGANRGLGRAFAEALLAAGARKVYGAARNASNLNSPGVQPLQLDVNDPASIAAAAEQAQDVNLLINNAGIFRPGPLLAGGDADLLAQFDTNVLGSLRMARAFAPQLQANGGGAIVNVLSALSWLVLPGTGAYSISKSAAWALSNALRTELRAQHTQVLAVHVAYMDTDMAAGVQAPKTAPGEVVQQVLAALQDDREEVLCDTVTRDLKRELGSARAPYLRPPGA